MKKHFKFSKRLHWAALCCFFLPFFYTGCGPGAEEKASAEKAKQDSVALINAGKVAQDSELTKSADTTIQSNTALAETSNGKASFLQPDAISTTDKESKMPSQKIVKGCKLLQPVLIPKEDTYTGIATVIDSIPFISYFAIFITFLFLIISLIIKFIDAAARKTIGLLDALALIFLFISQPYSWNAEKLWGFWVAITFVLVLTIYDCYIIKIHLAEDRE